MKYEDFCETQRESLSCSYPKWNTVQRAYHDNVSDALHSILENLYESGIKIDEHGLKSDFAYLCDKFDLPDDQLQDNELQAIHRAQAQKIRDEAVQRYRDELADMKTLVMDIKDRLCGDKVLNLGELESSLSKLCRFTGVPYYLGTKVKICRAPERSDLFDFALSLSKTKAI